MEEKVSLSEVIATFGGGFILEGDDYSNLDWQNTDITKPTEAEVNAKQAEMQSDYDAQEYARNRKLEYPSIDELVVALYDEDDKAAIEAKRAEIKAKYPKP